MQPREVNTHNIRKQDGNLTRHKRQPYIGSAVSLLYKDVKNVDSKAGMENVKVFNIRGQHDSGLAEAASQVVGGCNPLLAAASRVRSLYSKASRKSGRASSCRPKCVSAKARLLALQIAGGRSK